MTKNDRNRRPSPNRRPDGPSEQRDDRRSNSGSEKRNASGSGSEKRNTSGPSRPSSRPPARKAGPRDDQRSDRPAGGRGDSRDRGGDQRPSRPSGPRSDSRDRTDDQGRPRRDGDQRPTRSSGPRGDSRERTGDQGRPRREGDQRPGARGDSRDRDNDQGRPRRDGDQRPGRSTGPRGDSRERTGDQGRPRRESDQRPGPRGEKRERTDDQSRPRRDNDQRPERQSDRRDGFKGKPEGDRQQAYDAGRRYGERPGREDEARPQVRTEAVPTVLPEDILPGRKPVRELIEQSPQSVDDVLLRQGLRGADVDAIVTACMAAGVRYRFMPAGDMDKIYPGNHQGFLARLSAGDLASLEDVLLATKNAPLPVSLALDRVQDPGNVGTLARTLFALGGGGLIVPKHEGARLGPGAAKASAGTLSRLPVAKVSNLARALDEAREAGFTIIGAAGEAEALNVYTATPDFPIILVLGSEDEGIRPGVLKRCQSVYRIPQARPLDSINVAQAGAIILGRLASILDQGN
ncbi:RNA methyltransferase, TrmH family, group 3 [Desulfovibrio sp. DV]|uniref:TrmH family RNA methyltransferase n=1 Tax=Desulfovibrio sp. DV TaxID=1844708 RepID=UPI00095C7096|nr:RNA methyltransferase, TrmH family, group 3 [Desulfovibrio sp. DV]